MTIQSDLTALLSSYDTKIAAADATTAALKAAQADAAAAHTALTAALAADKTDKAATTAALAKLKTATDSLSTLQSTLTASQADDATNKAAASAAIAQVATLTSQLAAANAKIASLSGSTTPATPTTPVTPSAPVTNSVKLLTPFPATEITINQNASGAISSLGLLGSDTIVQAGQTVFSGTCSVNILNIEIYDVNGQSHRATLDGKGNWTVTIDTTAFATAPTVFNIAAWDSAPGTAFTVSLKGNVTVYLNNSAKPVPAMVAPDLAKGMKLIWSEDFSSGKIDTTKWQTGLRNSTAGGNQWGSDAYFGVLGVDSFAGDSYAVPMNRFGRLRAIHDTNFKDPTGWNQVWRSGLLSTAMVDPNNAKPVVSLKRGVVYLRAMMPSGKGPWPSLWGDTVNAPLSPSGDCQETDLIENNADAGATGFMTTTHLWSTDSSKNTSDGVWMDSKKPVLDAFHDFVFDFGATDPNTITVYIDGVKIGTTQMYAPAQQFGTYLMLDMAMGGGWPIEVPPGGIYDFHIQNFGIWSL